MTRSEVSFGRRKTVRWRRTWVLGAGYRVLENVFVS